jgi:hypothetical protein
VKQILRVVDDWARSRLGGHINIGGCRVVIYGNNAMHYAVNIRTRSTYICFRPTVFSMGAWRGWYFYLSPNATPWAATLAMGPGVDRHDKREARARRRAMRGAT